MLPVIVNSTEQCFNIFDPGVVGNPAPTTATKYVCADFTHRADQTPAMFNDIVRGSRIEQ